MRGQTSLPALAVALLLLVVSTLVAISVAGGELATAVDQRDALERQSVTSLSERLVAADSPLTTRANVVTADGLETLTVGELESRFGLDPESAVALTIDGDAVLSRGDTSQGTTIERIVLMENRSTRAITPRFESSRTVTLPRRSPTATLSISPSRNATVETVRANGHVLLRDTNGLRGQFRVDLSRFETVTLAFEGNGTLSPGSVTIEYRPSRTRKARLALTIDRWGHTDG